jgi:hypothetical protein
VRRVNRGLLPAIVIGLAFVQAGCQSHFEPWVPDEDHKVTIISDAKFVRTSRGEYVDGYLAKFQSQFEQQWMFMVLEIPHYLKGERVIVTGRFIDDSVRMSIDDQSPEKVPVFKVESARPNIPSASDVPALK